MPTDADRTQTSQPIRAEPVELSYREARQGEIAVSDVTMKAMMKTRPWALGCAVGMFIYALIGGFLGVMWLGVIIFKRGQPDVSMLQFAIITPPNLIGAPLALIGGILALRYHAAVGRAHTWRNSEDLERAIIRLGHVWRWAGVTVLALFAMPPTILFTGWMLGVGQ